jgi:hypothetical protein
MLDLTDGRYPRNLVGLFLADTVYAGRTKESFAVPIEDSNDVDYKLRFDLDFPTTNGALWRDLQWTDTEVNPAQFVPPIEGRFDISGFKGAHWIDEALFNRLTKSALGYTELIENEVEKINLSKYKTIQDHLLTYDSVAQGLTGVPTRQGNPQPVWATWGADDRTLMHIGYPLQKGGTGNSSTLVSEYQYGGNINLNSSSGSADFTRMKAVTYGNTSTGFGYMDPSGIRTNIDPQLVRADKQNAGGRQICVCDSAVYNFILNYGEQYVRLVNATELKNFGYRDILDYMGRWWVYEPYLDELMAISSATPYRTVYGFDASTWIFRHHKLDMTESVPGSELKERQGVKMLWKWDFRAQMLCKKPWRNWMAYNVSV